MTQYLTRQEIFDKAVGGVIAQGGASITYDGDAYNYGKFGEKAECQYRTTPTGAKRACTVGQLIADENYTAELENEIADSLKIRHAFPDINCVCDEDFLLHLQICHDDATMFAANDEEFLVAFRTLAHDLGSRFQLSTEILNA